MTDSEGSNALVAVVQFYSQALARSEEQRRQLEAALRQALEQKTHPPASPWMKVVRAADDYVESDRDGGTYDVLQEAVNEFRKSSRRNVDRMEPATAHQGSVRGASTDRGPDLQDPDSRG